LPVRPTVHSAVLPAVTPDRATDFLGLKPVAEGSAMGVVILRNLRKIRILAND